MRMKRSGVAGRMSGVVAVGLASVALAVAQSDSRPATRPTTTAAPVTAASTEWPMLRGDAQNTGVAGSALPEKLGVRWKYELGAESPTTAAIAGTQVYVGGEDGRLVALELETGELKWEYRAGEAISAAPTVTDGLVVFGDEGGTLHGCDARTGERRWTFKTDDRIVSAVNPHGERLVFGSYDGGLYCVRAKDGELIWRYEVGERVHGTPAIIESHVLTAACDARLHVVNIDDGRVVRKVELGAVSGAAVAVRGATAWIPTYGEQVVCVDWRQGRVIWRFEEATGAFPFLSSAALGEDVVLVGGRDKRLRAVDAATGAGRWEFVTRGKVDSSPVRVGERVFVGSADGNVYGVDVRMGRELWRYEAGSAILASPAVGAGSLVISTETGTVLCFGAAREVR